MAWTPFGTKPDEFWFPEGTPTFTLEEYLMSTLFTNPVKVWTDKTGEAGIYFNINASVALAAAIYYKGETVAMLRFMKFLQASPYLTWGFAVVGSGVLMASAPGLTSRDRAEILGGAPGASDSFLEKMLKLSF